MDNFDRLLIAGIMLSLFAWTVTQDYRIFKLEAVTHAPASTVVNDR